MHQNREKTDKKLRNFTGSDHRGKLSGALAAIHQPKHRGARCHATADACRRNMVGAMACPRPASGADAAISLLKSALKGLVPYLPCFSTYANSGLPPPWGLISALKTGGGVGSDSLNVPLRATWMSVQIFSGL